MIPADVASRLQVSADTTLRPVAPVQEISDKLSGLVAGQKVMAEVQTLLPNGTYRALINQRNITLALPFSAKSGDSLELLVTESDGKLALAVLSRPDSEGDKSAASTTSTTLSRTGQLISSLLSGSRDAKGGATALALNGNQPLAGSPPSSAQDLAPMLKQAITQSGMFYEAHQAEWVEGRLAKAELLQEPQGKLSSPEAFATTTGEATSATNLKASVETAAAPRLAADATQTPGTSIDASKSNSGSQAVQNQTQTVAPQAQPIVQQQLDALATQNFSWQGQVWPGQDMRWEIDEDAAQNGQDEDETASKWTTRLHLTLPNLGEVDAQVRLNGNQITLVMSAGSEETRALMRAASFDLRSQLDDAGLTLASMGVSAPAESRVESGIDGQTGQ